MANAKSHHLNNREMHVLVAIDGQPREASYTTEYDDGTTGATVHVLYYEKNPDKPADPLAQTGGEVRSCPYEEWKKPTQPIYEPPESAPVLARDAQGAVIPLVWDDLVGKDAATLLGEAADLLRLYGGVDSAGKVLAVEAWAKPS